MSAVSGNNLPNDQGLAREIGLRDGVGFLRVNRHPGERPKRAPHGETSRLTQLTLS